jgi:hypothetical protein
LPKANCKLVGLSVDGLYSHIAWLRTIKEKIEYKGMKNVEVKFPLIEDITMEVARKYGMIQPGESTTKAVRAVFFIDPKGIIRAIIYYPLSLGSNFDELYRILLALQTADAFGVATRPTGGLATTSSCPRRFLRRGQRAHGGQAGGHHLLRLVLLHQETRQRDGLEHHPEEEVGPFAGTFPDHGRGGRRKPVKNPLSVPSAFLITPPSRVCRNCLPTLTEVARFWASARGRRRPTP